MTVSWTGGTQEFLWTEETNTTGFVAVEGTLVPVGSAYGTPELRLLDENTERNFRLNLFPSSLSFSGGVDMVRGNPDNAHNLLRPVIVKVTVSS